jgi:acetylornithine deacetylase
MPPARRFGVCYEVHYPFELPAGAPIIEATLRAYRWVTGEEPAVAGGAILPDAPSASPASTSYAADDTSHLMRAGIPCLLYGPGGYYDRPHSDSYTHVSEMETVAKVLAVLAADVCSATA